MDCGMENLAQIVHRKYFPQISQILVKLFRCLLCREYCLISALMKNMHAMGA